MSKLKFTILFIVFLIGAFFAVIIPLMGFILGLICIGIATPKKDGRFKTGFRNNEEVNRPLATLGYLWIAIAILSFTLVRG